MNNKLKLRQSLSWLRGENPPFLGGFTYKILLKHGDFERNQVGHCQSPSMSPRSGQGAELRRRLLEPGPACWPPRIASATPVGPVGSRGIRGEPVMLS